MRHAVETDIIIPTASATRHATSLFYLSVKNQQKPWSQVQLCQVSITHWHWSELSGVDSKLNKKLDYCRRAAQRAVSVRISSIAAQQIQNKSKWQSYRVTGGWCVVNSREVSTLIVSSRSSTIDAFCWEHDRLAAVATFLKSRLWDNSNTAQKTHHHSNKNQYTAQ